MSHSNTCLLVLGVSLVTLLPTINPLCAAEHTKLPLPDIKQQIDNKQALLIDCREQSEWDDGHIHDATFFPLSSVRDGLTPAELSRLPKDKPLYIHCASGRRCLLVTDALLEKGYLVHALKPGYEDLLKSGFRKAESSTNSPSSTQTPHALHTHLNHSPPSR